MPLRGRPGLRFFLFRLLTACRFSAIDNLPAERELMLLTGSTQAKEVTHGPG